MDNEKIEESKQNVEHEKNDEDFFEYELIIKALGRLSKIVKREEEFIEKKQYDKAVELIPDKIELVNFFQKIKRKFSIVLVYLRSKIYKIRKSLKIWYKICWMFLVRT